MYLLYIDESGTSAIPGNTSHFILAGLSIPIWHWKNCDRAIEAIKRSYSIQDSEIHIAWVLRAYPEQNLVPNFEALSYSQRRSQVESLRRAELLRLQSAGNPHQYRQTKKNFRETEGYIHLSFAERQDLGEKIAACIGEWGFARLFAECIDKIHFDPSRTAQTVDEQAFEQIVSRFSQYVSLMNVASSQRHFGLLIHDNNETIAKKLTILMKGFHRQGTLWRDIDNLIETPLFVNSELTSMVQIADVCAYSLRRYLENRQEKLFNLVFKRADRKDGVVVGVRHFASQPCNCQICIARRTPAISAPSATSGNQAPGISSEML